MDLPINKQPDTFKETFEVKLAEYEQQNQGSQRQPWTSERILEVINNVRKARVSITSKQDRTSMDYYWISKYDTMVTANEVFLIFKRKSPDDPTVRILPRNEYFNTLEAIHKECGHGGRDKMLHGIKSRYYIPRKAIEIFLAHCPACETKKALSKKPMVTRPIVSQDLNIRGQVELLDFQSCPDGYKWLLNYQDNTTKFVSLRPLKTEKAQEVAMELMKIFMIFGAPYILQSDNGREFTAKIIEEITPMWPEFQIVDGSPMHPQTQGSVEGRHQDIENMLRAWMNDNNTTNWSVGCHHVQYKKNVSFHSKIGKSPYKALFGCNPKAALHESDIPTSMLSTRGTTEQLQELSQKEFSSKMNLVNSPSKSVKSEIPEQIKSNANIKLEPCCSKILRDESARNNSQVQEQPDEEKDHTQIEELVKKEPNFTCVVCKNDCTGAHKCASCENALHAICGFSDEKPGGCGSKVRCRLCKGEQDNLQPDRNRAPKGTKRAAEEMVNDAPKKIPKLSIGDAVMISVPKIDRGPLDTQKVRGKILDFQNGVYKVGTKSGIIKNWFAQHEIEISSEDYNDDISDTLISLREAASRASVFGVEGFQKCICKPAQRQCQTNRCACFKKNILCGSKCHSSLSCVNK